VNIGGDMRFGRWRQFIAEVSVGASAIAIAFAAIGVMAELILGAIALVGVALLLEFDVLAQSAGTMGPQPQRPSVEPESARPYFDAAVVDATSV
jgi:hypothetical protein